MAEPEVTTMGEKGQVVIPQALRRELGVKPKTKFAIYGQGDIIVLKRLELPDLHAEWEQVFKAAGKSRATEADVAKEIQAVRKRRR